MFMVFLIIFQLYRSEQNVSKPTFIFNRTLIKVSVFESIMKFKLEKLNLEVKEKVEENTEVKLETKEISLFSKYNSIKSYMDYRKITSKSSAQYQLLYSGEIIFCDDGLLKDKDGYVAVAIGSRYSKKIGDRFIVTFDNGKQQKLIAVDHKADKDTYGGSNAKADTSMIEMIVDISKCRNSEYAKAIYDGDFNSHPDFEGNIIKIEKVI